MEQAGNVVGGRGRELDLTREELHDRDPVMRGLIDANLDHHAWCKTLSADSLFETLLYQIVGQQISVTAANAINAADEHPIPLMSLIHQF